MNFDRVALVVWQPEDVILVRDLLDMEHEPLNELLKVEPFRLSKENGSENDTNKNNELVKVNINVNTTANGRPINNQHHVRWKPMEVNQKQDEKVEMVSVDSYFNPDEKHYKFIANLHYIILHVNYKSIFSFNYKVLSKIAKLVLPEEIQMVI